MRDTTLVDELTGLDARSIATYVAMMLTFSGALVITDGIIHTPIRVPGHSAVFWIPVLVVAGAQKWPGMAAGSSIIGGGAQYLWFGQGVDNAICLMAAGAVVEAMALFKHTDTAAAWMVFAGLAGNFGKLAIKALMALVFIKPLNAAGLQFLQTALLYAAFGITGGAIAWTFTSAGKSIKEKGGLFGSNPDE